MKNKLLVHNDEVRKEMLEQIGLNSFDELFKNIDAGIRLREELDLPESLSELETKQRLISLAKQNSTTSNNAYFIGGGCYNKFSPACISYLTQRSEFLTAYTPYQPEISQGTLQIIFDISSVLISIFRNYDTILYIFNYKMDVEIAN